MLILLDIDGVMVPATSWKASEILNDGFANFSSKATSSLQRIISETGASIVLTTSHKSNYSVSEWVEIFKTRGIITSIEKLEDNLNNLSRKDEILNWLNSRETVENIVIIDDDKSLNGLPDSIKAKFVLTSSIIGLSQDGASAAIEVLKNSELVIA